MNEKTMADILLEELKNSALIENLGLTIPDIETCNDNLVRNLIELQNQKIFMRDLQSQAIDLNSKDNEETKYSIIPKKIVCFDKTLGLSYNMNYFMYLMKSTVPIYIHGGQRNRIDYNQLATGAVNDFFIKDLLENSLIKYFAIFELNSRKNISIENSQTLTQAVTKIPFLLISNASDDIYSQIWSANNHIEYSEN